MDTKTASILSIACVAMLLQSTGQANFGGSDNFNDNSEDLTKWNTDSGFGTPAGVLTETNGRLEFTSSGTADIYQARPWKLNFGSYVSNWDVQLDTVVPANSGPNGGFAFGLEISPNSNLDLYVGIEHETYGTSSDYFFYHGITNDGPIDTARSASAPTLGAIRISFNASTKVLTTYYDADGPSNGYQWTFGASYGIAGSGGATANTNWGMTAADTFTAFPHGFSSGVAVTSGQVYGDNFVATPEPSGAILLVGGSLLLAFRRKQDNRNA